MAVKQKWKKSYFPQIQTMIKFLWKPLTPAQGKEAKAETVLPVFHYFPSSLFDPCRSV